MIIVSQARTFLLVLVLATVALGLLAVRSARQGTGTSSGAAATTAAVPGQATAGSGAAQRHGYRVALGR